MFPCRKLESEFPGAFGWAGEINVFKHALASNGFFHQNRVTERMLHNGDLDYLFNVLSDRERSSWQHKVELASLKPSFTWPLSIIHDTQFQT